MLHLKKKDLHIFYLNFVPCLVMDKVRKVFVSGDLDSNVYVQLVPNKSHSQEIITAVCPLTVVSIKNIKSLGSALS